jgi:hypothetical protein
MGFQADPRAATRPSSRSPDHSIPWYRLRPHASQNLATQAGEMPSQAIVEQEPGNAEGGLLKLVAVDEAAGIMPGDCPVMAGVRET